MAFDRLLVDAAWCLNEQGVLSRRSPTRPTNG